MGKTNSIIKEFKYKTDQNEFIIEIDNYSAKIISDLIVTLNTIISDDFCKLRYIKISLCNQRSVMDTNFNLLKLFTNFVYCLKNYRHIRYEFIYNGFYLTRGGIPDYKPFYNSAYVSSSNLLFLNINCCHRII